jgi:hypothetical protein
LVGVGVHFWLSQTLQLIVGIPAILLAFGAVLWTTGFGPEDRELFRMRKADVRELREAQQGARAREQIRDDIV